MHTELSGVSVCHLRWNKGADAVLEAQRAQGQPTRPREVADRHHLGHATSVNVRLGRDARETEPGVQLPGVPGRITAYRSGWSRRSAARALRRKRRIWTRPNTHTMYCTDMALSLIHISEPTRRTPI